MKKRTLKIILFSGATLVILAAAAVGVVFYIAKANAVTAAGSLYIPRGADYETLVDSLRSGHRIRFERPFRIYSEHIGLTRNVKPGHYVLEKGMNIIDIARMLNLGQQTPVNVVVNMSRIPGQLSARVSRQIEADSASLHAAMRDPELLAKYGYRNELEMFSMFIPNTYEFWWTVTPDEFIARMKTEYDRFWTDERETRLRKSAVANRMEAITLASILCEETRKTDEMPRMAGVYLNRIEKGMPLQADPTVKYATGDFALRRILKKHLKTESPYNTYLNKGLPPTPICMPSIAAIDAVLNAEKHNYIYFCAKEDFSGYHNFAETYSQHLQNARRYSAELNKRNIR